MEELTVNPDDDRNYDITYTYNESNQLIREVLKYLDGRIQSDQSFIYDENSRLVSGYYRDTKTGKKSKVTVKYICDSQGNWTSKKTYRKKKIEQTEEREIAYY